MPTNWYNYALATAETIVDKNTTSGNPAANTTEANESICPKGWTLPNKTQIDSQRNTISFFPIVGGGYNNSALYLETRYGVWWGNEAYNDALRYGLGYNGNALSTDDLRRYNGGYIRCVQAP